MKKFFKFVCGAASMAAVAFGAYCVYKKVTENNTNDEDDFEDCFEEETIVDSPEEREYVSINITEEAAEDTEAAEEETEE